MGLFTTVETPNFLNYPSGVFLNNYMLPSDVIVGIDGEKVIAESKILDGVAVFERICRNPFDLNFEFTLWDYGMRGQNVFPQSMAEDLMKEVFTPNMAVDVFNTFLNGLGIKNAVIKNITYATFRGSTKIVCSIKAKESPDDKNNFGTTLVIPL